MLQLQITTHTHHFIKWRLNIDFVCFFSHHRNRKKTKNTTKKIVAFVPIWRSLRLFEGVSFIFPVTWFSITGRRREIETVEWKKTRAHFYLFNCDDQYVSFSLGWIEKGCVFIFIFYHSFQTYKMRRKKLIAARLMTILNPLLVDLNQANEETQRIGKKS